MTGKDMKDIRSRFGLTQCDLAGRLGVSPHTIGRWEREGKIPKPIALFVRELANSGFVQRTTPTETH